MVALVVEAPENVKAAEHPPTTGVVTVPLWRVTVADCGAAPLVHDAVPRPVLVGVVTVVEVVDEVLHPAASIASAIAADAPSAR
jgi:hypothetical protein